MASPTCQVKDGSGSYQATTNGVNVTPANTVTIGLVSTAGVRSWGITCVYTDDTSDAATVTAALSVNNTAKTATFTAPAAGKAYIFQSQVNSGNDANGAADASLTTTLGVYTLTSGSLRVLATNETQEGNASFGWVKSVNAKIREAGGSTTPTGSGFAHVTSGAYDAAAVSVDLTNYVTHVTGILQTSHGGTGLNAAGMTTGQVVRATGATGFGVGAVDLANVSAITGTLPVGNGGTGIAAAGMTTGQVLRATGAAAFGAGAVDLANSSAITGTLPVANGGTGIAPGAMSVGQTLVATGVGTFAAQDPNFGARNVTTTGTGTFGALVVNGALPRVKQTAFSGAGPFTYALTDGHALVTPSAAAAFNLPTASLTAGDRAKITDVTAVFGTYNLTIDAGSGNSIIGFTSAQTLTVVDNGASVELEVIATSPNKWKVV